MWNDLRFAVRQLWKSPGFTFTAVTVLAVGTCAAVAIFAFVDAALIRPLPYREPSRLVTAFETTTVFAHSNLSYMDFQDWKKMNTVFQSLDAYQGRRFTLTTGAGREFVRAARVSAGFFRTLGVAPVLGRDFHEGEDKPAEPRAVLLSYGIWQQKYGGRRDIVGQAVTLEDGAWTVIGVLPRGFHFAPVGAADYWMALRPVGGCELRRTCHNLYGLARLKDGVSVEAARTSVAALAKELERQNPTSNRDQGGTVVALAEVIMGDIRPVLMTLLYGAGLLLLIAAVNVAGLLQVRSEGRARELSVRRALGASRGRLAAQFVVEAGVLVAAGGALGVAGAGWAMELLKKLLTADLMERMPFFAGLGWNLRVAAFAGVTALLSGALFTAATSFRLGRRELREGLAEGGRGGAGTAWRKIGSKLVIIELAAAMVLLTGAGLLGKSLYQLLRVDLGLRPGKLLTLELVAPAGSYSKDDQQLALAREIASRIEGLPGVTGVGYETNGEPMGGNGNTTWLRPLGKPWNGAHNDIAERDVSAGYFTALGARLARGRYFTEADNATAPWVAIVNRAFVRKIFPGEDAVGKQVAYMANTKAPPMEIVGVVEDIREGPMDAEIPPFLYRPFNQSSDRFLSLVVRTSREEQAVLAEMTAAIRQLDRDIVTTGAMTMAARINDTQAVYIHRLSAWLVGGFAGLALLVGVVGLYGVIAYSVSQRTREIGVRMALGAQPAAVYRLVLREAAWLTAAGVAVGALCSVGAARVMQGLLFGVSAWDGPTLCGVAAVLGAAAVAASFMPARKAAGINPVEALRAD